MILPFDGALLQPASYELTFDGSLVYVAREQELDDMCYFVKERKFMYASNESQTVFEDNVWEKAPHDLLTGGTIIFPGKFYIASSKEMLNIPTELMARFEGKSTLGRAGLMVHITAGYIDPGFNGNLTLEIANVAPWPIVICDGAKIGQLSFHVMDQIPERSYGNAGNHYQGQLKATLPR
jgi:deoxycytidine triphosphate deaminase